MERDDHHVEQLLEAAQLLALQVRQSVDAGATTEQISALLGIPEDEVEHLRVLGVSDPT